MCALSREPEFLWLAPGSSVCQDLFPADTRWLPSSSPPALPVVLLNCQQHRTRDFTQQPCGVNEHTCTNMTLGGRRRACMLSKSIPGGMKAKEQRRTSPYHCSPYFTHQAAVPRQVQMSDLHPCGWIEETGQSDTSCQDTLSTVASV